MRNRERGIGNMAFISVLILFVVSTALAFVWRDEGEWYPDWQLRVSRRSRGENAKAAARTANANAADADLEAQNWQKAYNAMKEVVGMTDASIEGGVGKVPNPDDIKKFVRGKLFAKGKEVEAAAAVNLNTSNYAVDASKGTIEKTEGDTVTLKVFSLATAQDTITVQQLIDYYPTPLVNVKEIAETNNQKNTQTHQRLTQELAAKNQSLEQIGSAYDEDKTLKQGVIDKQKNDLSSLRETVESQTAKLDAAATQVEQTKQEAEREVRQLQLEVSALQNRLRNEQIRKELALREDPSDGEVLAVSNTYGTVWIGLGRRQRVSRGTKFQVWRAAKGDVRQNIAVVEVIRVADTRAECKIIRQMSTTRVTAGMQVSNPFFDPSQQLTAFIFGNLRTYPNEVAKRRLAASGITVARYLDDRIDIIILGEPPVSIEEVYDEEEAESIRRKQQLERSKRLDEILEKARSINALVVTEETLATFIEF